MIKKETIDLITDLAGLVGAIGGVLAIVLSFVALVWDRSRLLIRVRKRLRDDFLEDELAFGEGFLERR